jgi:hypothetical protein
VKSILREVLDVDRVVIREAKSYCGILLDDNNRKPICRLRFNTSNKLIGLFKNKVESAIPIDNLNDIYTYGGQIKQTVEEYDNPVPVSKTSGSTEGGADSTVG